MEKKKKEHNGLREDNTEEKQGIFHYCEMSPPNSPQVHVLEQCIG